MNNRFWSKSTQGITPYTPGEQPHTQRYVKLNTNECPYPPSPRVQEVLRGFDSASMRLYPDPDNAAFTAALAKRYGLQPDQVLACGGSDEALAFAFMAFFDRGDAVCFADISYGFYQVYADLFQLNTQLIPLRSDFTIVPEDYAGAPGHIFLANPNSPTAITLSPPQIEIILRQNPDRLVIVDEAYCDFAPGYSCMNLLNQYDNLLIIRTLSKSHALAGMRLGAAFGNSELIEGMRRVKYSFNPYNLDRVSAAIGIAALEDQAYYDGVVAKITATLERVSDLLWQLGFTVLPSHSNFLFIRHPSISGEALYRKLKEHGVLVRHFAKPRISDFIRVSIGTDEEMDIFLDEIVQALGRDSAESIFQHTVQDHLGTSAPLNNYPNIQHLDEGHAATDLLKEIQDTYGDGDKA